MREDVLEMWFRHQNHTVAREGTSFREVVILRQSRWGGSDASQWFVGPATQVNPNPRRTLFHVAQRTQVASGILVQQCPFGIGDRESILRGEP